MAGRDRGRLRVVALVGLFALLWWQTDVTLPGDLGAWRPDALPGELVYDLAELDGVVHAAAHTGLYVLDGPEPSEPYPDLPTPVVRLADDGRTWLVATGEGVHRLDTAGGSRPAGLQQERVNDLVHAEDRWLAATDTGVFERVDDEWVRRWPADEEAQALTVAASSGRLLVGTRAGIVRLDPSDGSAETVWDGGIVRALFPDDRPGYEDRLWAGTVGDEVLLASEDEGRSWQRGGEGLRLLSAQDVRSHPGQPDRLVVGGTGVDDGELLGGVMVSDDGGSTWDSEPNRLSNTHVYRLAVDREPLVVDVAWPLLARSSALELPIDIARFRAATNGAGVYTYAEPPAGLRLLALLQPTVRVVEPLVAGAIFLALLWQLARIGGPQATRRPDDPARST